ncbi:C40 family peptidase [Mannheimia haemolytica]|nr:C40 family peptidase [Mannheimia haemolytica]
MELEQQIIDYALQHEPHEMCGFVVFDGNKNRFIPCENQAEDKANYFEISDLDYIKAEAQGELVAVVHSHPEPNGKPVVGADVPNHAAIYIGDQMVVHHSPNRLSKRDLYDGYWLRHTHSIWRHKLAEKLDFDGILNDIAVNN